MTPIYYTLQGYSRFCSRSSLGFSMKLRRILSSSRMNLCTLGLSNLNCSTAICSASA
jgi:hypothetical protein